MSTTYRERTILKADHAALRRLREEYEDCMKTGRRAEARRVLAAHDRLHARLNP